MKKILILMCLKIALFGNIYDTKTIQNDFKAGNTARYHNDVIPYVDKTIAKTKYLKLSGEGSIIAPVPDIEGYEGANAKIMEVFKCPQGGMGYSTSIYSVDFATLSMTCMVARESSLEKPLALFSWSLKDYGSGYEPWVKYFEKDLKKAAADNADAINASKLQFAGLEAARVEAKNASLGAGANIGIPKIIVGTLLGDTELIDVQSSVNHGAIVLKEGNVVKGGNFLKTKNATTVSADDASFSEVWNVDPDDVGGGLKWLSNLTAKFASMVGIRENLPLVAQKINNEVYEHEDKSSDVITSRLVNLIEFYPKFSQLNQDFYFVLLGVVGLAGVLFFASHKFAENENKSNIFMWVVGIGASMVIFFPAHTHEVEINNENMKLSQNNFSKFEAMGYYTAIDFANGIAQIVIDNEMDSIARRAGAINSSTIIQVAAQNELIGKERKAAIGALMYCSDHYNIDYTKHYTLKKNSVFPMSEQYVYARYVHKGLTPNFYSNIENNGLAKIQTGKEYPVISLTGCNKIESKIDYLEKVYEKNEALLAKAIMGADNDKIRMIEALYASQYGMLEEWEYMSIIALPTIVYKSEQLGNLFDSKNDDSATKILQEDNSGFIESFVSSTPYFLIPGASSFYELFKDNSGKIAGAAASAAATTVLPFVGTVGGGVVGTVAGFLAGDALGFYLTQLLMKNFLSILPIVGIIMLGLLINLKIIIKIFTYHLMAPFVILLAFTKQNVQLMLNYVARVITIMFEIPIFVLSVFAAMAARDILMAIGTPLSSTVLVIMQEINITQGGDFFLKFIDSFIVGLVNLSIQIFAFIIIYKILSTYHTQIFEAMEVKTAAAFDGAINESLSSAQGWGSRI